jgi:hypothetical protein
MGCAVTKQEQLRRQRLEEEHRLNQYWYDREEHLITVHEASSIADPADLRTDLPQSKEQQAILRGAVGLNDIRVATSPADILMPEKAAKVLLDLDAVRRDSGIDIDSCLGEEDEDEEDDDVAVGTARGQPIAHFHSECHRFTVTSVQKYNAIQSCLREPQGGGVYVYSYTPINHAVR